MSLQSALRAVVTDDDVTFQSEHLERAVEQALGSFDTKPEPHATLIKRSRESFAKNLQHLQERIEAVNASVLASTKQRDQMVAEAERLHQSRVAEAERDLHQATTVRTAIEQAHATLTQARDE